MGYRDKNNRDLIERDYENENSFSEKKSKSSIFDTAKKAIFGRQDRTTYDDEIEKDENYASISGKNGRNNMLDNNENLGTVVNGIRLRSFVENTIPVAMELDNAGTRDEVKNPCIITTGLGIEINKDGTLNYNGLNAISIKRHGQYHTIGNTDTHSETIGNEARVKQQNIIYVNPSRVNESDNVAICSMDMAASAIYADGSLAENTNKVFEKIGTPSRMCARNVETAALEEEIMDRLFGVRTVKNSKDLRDLEQLEGKMNIIKETELQEKMNKSIQEMIDAYNLARIRHEEELDAINRQKDKYGVDIFNICMDDILKSQIANIAEGFNAKIDEAEILKNAVEDTIEGNLLKINNDFKVSFAELDTVRVNFDKYANKSVSKGSRERHYNEARDKFQNGVLSLEEIDKLNEYKHRKFEGRTFSKEEKEDYKNFIEGITKRLERARTDFKEELEFNTDIGLTQKNITEEVNYQIWKTKVYKDDDKKHMKENISETQKRNRLRNDLSSANLNYDRMFGRLNMPLTVLKEKLEDGAIKSSVSDFAMNEAKNRQVKKTAGSIPEIKENIAEIAKFKAEKMDNQIEELNNGKKVSAEKFVNTLEDMKEVASAYQTKLFALNNLSGVPKNLDVATKEQYKILFGNKYQTLDRETFFNELSNKLQNIKYSDGINNLDNSIQIMFEETLENRKGKTGNEEVLQLATEALEKSGGKLENIGEFNAEIENKFRRYFQDALIQRSKVIAGEELNGISANSLEKVEIDNVLKIYQAKLGEIEQTVDMAVENGQIEIMNNIKNQVAIKAVLDSFNLKGIDDTVANEYNRLLEVYNKNFVETDDNLSSKEIAAQTIENKVTKEKLQNPLWLFQERARLKYLIQDEQQTIQVRNTGNTRNRDGGTDASYISDISNSKKLEELGRLLDYIENNVLSYENMKTIGNANFKYNETKALEDTLTSFIKTVDGKIPSLKRELLDEEKIHKQNLIKIDAKFTNDKKRYKESDRYEKIEKENQRYQEKLRDIIGDVNLHEASKILKNLSIDALSKMDVDEIRRTSVDKINAILDDKSSVLNLDNKIINQKQFGVMIMAAGIPSGTWDLNEAIKDMLNGTYEVNENSSTIYKIAEKQLSSLDQDILKQYQDEFLKIVDVQGFDKGIVDIGRENHIVVALPTEEEELLLNNRYKELSSLANIGIVKYNNTRLIGPDSVFGKNTEDNNAALELQRCIAVFNNYNSSTEETSVKIEKFYKDLLEACNNDETVFKNFLDTVCPIDNNERELGFIAENMKVSAEEKSVNELTKLYEEFVTAQSGGLTDSYLLLSSTASGNISLFKDSNSTELDTTPADMLVRNQLLRDYTSPSKSDVDIIYLKDEENLLNGIRKEEEKVEEIDKLTPSSFDKEWLELSDIQREKVKEAIIDGKLLLKDGVIGERYLKDGAEVEKELLGIFIKGNSNNLDFIDIKFSEDRDFIIENVIRPSLKDNTNESLSEILRKDIDGVVNKNTAFVRSICEDRDFFETLPEIEKENLYNLLRDSKNFSTEELDSKAELYKNINLDVDMINNERMNLGSISKDSYNIDITRKLLIEKVRDNDYDDLESKAKIISSLIENSDIVDLDNKLVSREIKDKEVFEIVEKLKETGVCTPEDASFLIDAMEEDKKLEEILFDKDDLIKYEELKNEEEVKLVIEEDLKLEKEKELEEEQKTEQLQNEAQLEKDTKVEDLETKIFEKREELEENISEIRENGEEISKEQEIKQLEKELEELNKTTEEKTLEKIAAVIAIEFAIEELKLADKVKKEQDLDLTKEQLLELNEVKTLYQEETDKLEELKEKKEAAKETVILDNAKDFERSEAKENIEQVFSVDNETFETSKNYANNLENAINNADEKTAEKLLSRNHELIGNYEKASEDLNNKYKLSVESGVENDEIRKEAEQALKNTQILIEAEKKALKNAPVTDNAVIDNFRLASEKLSEAIAAFNEIKREENKRLAESFIKEQEDAKTNIIASKITALPFKDRKECIEKAEKLSNKEETTLRNLHETKSVLEGSTSLKELEDKKIEKVINQLDSVDKERTMDIIREQPKEIAEKIKEMEVPKECKEVASEVSNSLGR